MRTLIVGAAILAALALGVICGGCSNFRVGVWVQIGDNSRQQSAMDVTNQAQSVSGGGQLIAATNFNLTVPISAAGGL